MSRRIIVVGACYLDTILTVPHFPTEDSKLRATALSKRRGGNVPNTAEVFSQLIKEKHQSNLSLSLCVVLPSESSAAVQEIKASLGENVDFSFCIFRENVSEPASSYIVKSRETGSRTIVNYNPLEEMTLQEFAARVKCFDEDLAWVHFEGRIPEVTLECMRFLRQNFKSIKLSVEVEKPGREGLEALAAEADVVFYSRSWTEENGYKSAVECLKAQATTHTTAWKNRKVVQCCTWGAGGATALEFPSMSITERPAFFIEERPLVDAVGAGDTFIAGILYGCMQAEETSLGEKLAFANEIAGRKVAQEGFGGLGQAVRPQLPPLR